MKDEKLWTWARAWAGTRDIPATSGEVTPHLSVDDYYYLEYLDKSTKVQCRRTKRTAWVNKEEAEEWLLKNGYKLEDVQKDVLPSWWNGSYTNRKRKNRES